MTIPANSRVAVLIPCLNEELTIGKVLDAFRAQLPEAELVVIDNGSEDATATVARERGATVLREPRRGKGNAVRRAFRDVGADVFVLVDGDDTYPADRVHDLLAPVRSGVADVVIGTRLDEEGSEFRRLNRLGNHLLLWAVNAVFSSSVTDLLSGYRVMTREFVRKVPLLSTGFEVETELTIVALDRDMRTVEVPIRLGSRPEGSSSKIRIWSDGLRILKEILALFRDYRPLAFFGWLGLAFMLVGLAPGVFVTIEFIERGTVRIPTAVLATGLEIVGFTLLVTGVILSALRRRFREIDYHLDRIQERLGRDPGGRGTGGRG
jgi:glycosyltransferase involved in cell wall biosynthesis